MSLPLTNAFVRLRLLNGGSGNAKTKLFHQDIEVEEDFRLYNWAFHIYEPQSHRHALWDVGQSSVRQSPTEWFQSILRYVTQDKADYIPSIGKFIDALSCLGPAKSLGEQLRAHGTQPTDVDSIIFR